MLSQGLSKKDYAKFLNLDRTNAGLTIPDINIDGKVLGYPGFYFKKINVQDETQAARAACLGKLTHCCQSLSGEAGEPCVIHGLTSPNGGFYILCKGDIANPQISDPVIAQSWVWRSTTNALVFDSVETGLKEFLVTTEQLEMIKKFYRHVGKTLCLSQETSKVLCGARSGISSSVGMGMVLDNESYKDYKGYSDSQAQLCIYDTEKPWYLFQQDNELTQRTLSILDTAMQSDKPLVASTIFCEMLNWALIYDTTDNTAKAVLKRITLSSTQGLRKKQEIESLIQNTKGYLDSKIDLDTVTSLIDSDSFDINTFNKYGETLLMRACEEDRFDLLEQLIKKGAPLHRRDLSGKAILHYAVNKPEALKLLLACMTEEEGQKAILAQDKNLNTVIHLTVAFPELFKMLLNYLPDEAKRIVVLMDDGEFRKPLHLAATNFELLDILLALIPEKDKLSAVQETDMNWKSVLHYAASNPLSLKAILNLYPKGSQSDALKTKDYADHTALHYASSNLESFKYIMGLLSKQELLEIIKARDSDGATLLHSPYLAIEVIKLIFSLYTEEEQLTAMQATNDKQQTVLHCAAENPELLKELLNLFPNDRLKLMETKDSVGKMPIHCAVKQPESIQIIKAFYSEKDWFEVMKLKTLLGKNLVHLAVEYPQSLELLLGFYPKEEVLDAINMTYDYAKGSLMHLAHPKSIEVILKYISKNDILHAVTTPNYVGYYALKNTDSLKVILNFIPSDQMLNAFQSLDGNGLKELATDVDQVIEMLKKIPQEQWLNVLKRPYEHNEMFLELLATKPDNIKALFNFLPDELKFEALKIKASEYMETLLYTVEDVNCLLSILESFPNNKWIDVLTIGNFRYNTVLEKNFETLQAVLKKLPDNQKIDALMLFTKSGKPLLLHYGIIKTLGLLPKDKWMDALIKDAGNDDGLIIHQFRRDPKLLVEIVSPLSEEQKLTLLKTPKKYKSYYGNSWTTTILDVVFALPDKYTASIRFPGEDYLKPLKALFESLTQQSRIDLIKLRGNDSGGNLLHYTAVEQFELFTLLLNYLPHDEKLNALETKRKDGKTVLHLAIYNVDSVKTILELYPTQEEKMRAVMVCDESGKTVLDYTLSNGSEDSYCIIQPFLSEDKRKEIDADFLKKSPLFCIKVDNLEAFIALVEANKHENLYTTAHVYMKKALADNALHCIDWLLNNHIDLDDYVFKVGFKQFCKTNSDNYDNEVFKSILEKSINYSFKNTNWEYLGSIFEADSVISTHPDFETQGPGIGILIECYEKLAKQIKNNNATNSQIDDKQLKVLDWIHTNIKKCCLHDKESLSFIQNAAQAKDALHTLINDEHISVEELYSEVEKILLKGQAKPQNAHSFFNERTEQTPNQENVTDEKKDDTGMGNSNCTIV